MPFGHLLDQWQAYREFHGLTGRKEKALTIDDIIPPGI